MVSDPFYKTSTWRKLRAQVVKRAKGMCEVPTCNFVGHVLVARRVGGVDHADDLRLLCQQHAANSKGKNQK